MADRVETKNNWSYRNSYRWKRNFPQCNSDRQSPINIDTSKVSECNELCRLSTRYNPSKCHIINKNRTPTLRYDSGSYIKFRGVLYELSKITLHTPSMHTFNGSHYDMEVQLYHCNNIETDIRHLLDTLIDNVINRTHTINNTEVTKVLNLVKEKKEKLEFINVEKIA